MMVDFYRTGCRSDLMKPVTPRDVDEVQAELRAWWAVRRDLPYSLSVLRTRRDRVIGRTGRFGRIWQFTNDIRALPPVDNEVVMLCLLTEPHAFEHVDRQTLIYAARRLGPDRLMLMLEGQRLIDDPDYEQSGVDPSSFILEHAADLLRPTDVPRLRALAEAKMDYRYVIAAAELAPKDGVAWLRAALSEPERWWPQDRIAWVLWVLAGDTVADTVSEWFFVPPESYPICPPSRSTFVSELLVRFDASDRRLLARLIDDERFPELDWPTLKRIAAGLNDNLLNTVVDPKALSGLSHPLGECNFHAWVADHPSEYPEKTAVVQAALADWANAIRASRQYLAEPSGGTP
ncbi:MAG: hypothetical protein JXO22_01305, partial [Phycisphaerae bacterium]|nr:hypothetical protein [Phycisphaerae bacterium]